MSVGNNHEIGENLITAVDIAETKQLFICCLSYFHSKNL